MQDPRGNAVKDHNAIILRADALEVKMQWLSRLRRAAEGQRRSAAAVPAVKVRSRAFLFLSSARPDTGVHAWVMCAWCVCVWRGGGGCQQHGVSDVEKGAESKSKKQSVGEEDSMKRQAITSVTI